MAPKAKVEVETPVVETPVVETPVEEDELEVAEDTPLTTTDLINLAILSAKNHTLETQIVSRLNEAKQFII